MLHLSLTCRNADLKLSLLVFINLSLAWWLQIPPLPVAEQIQAAWRMITTHLCFQLGDSTLVRHLFAFLAGSKVARTHAELIYSTSQTGSPIIKSLNGTGTCIISAIVMINARWRCPIYEPLAFDMEIPWLNFEPRRIISTQPKILPKFYWHKRWSLFLC